jgi:hypothetical protein
MVQGLVFKVTILLPEQQNEGLKYRTFLSSQGKNRHAKS